jgi:class 3 adenylate cyclase/tetratricopeptide (TPR) repeat protein
MTSVTVARDLSPYAAAIALQWRSRFGDASCALLQGSLLKVDVSGFTRLSERLARSERTGAEEVNAVIDALWTELIGEVLDRGGDVLQFGGDALAVWFEGEGHEVRTAAAAAAMHRAVRGRPVQPTPAGKVRLRMSAGAESGEVGLGLVGTCHQELVVLGSVATAALRWETAARAGQTMVGENLATALERVGGRVERSEGGTLLRRVAEGPMAPARPWPSTDPALFLDPQVRELEEVGVPLGEHRRAAVAFLHLGGLDAVVAEQGLDSAHAQVARVAAAVEHHVGQNEVCWLATDVAPGGVVFLLVSGAPRSSENDEERMLRVLRGILDAVPDLPVRAGAHVGRGFAGDVGHPARRTFAVLGDTTNTAARLMGSAAAHEIRISAPLFERSARDHDVTWIGSLSLKGRQQGVVAGLLGERVAPLRTSTHDLPLLGRDTERAELDGLVSSTAEGGGGGAVLLLGPAGVGKSRLVTDVAAGARTRGLAVLVTQAEPYETAIPFGAVRSALRELLGLTGDNDVSALRALCGDEADLAPLLGLPLDVEMEATAASTAIDPAFVSPRRVTLLAEVIMRTAPRLLVVVEDLQLVDRATLGLLEELASHVADPLLLLVTGRELPTAWPTDPDAWSRRDVGPLDDDAARSLVLRVAGDTSLDDLQIQRVLTAADGNPLFLRELVLWAAEQEDADVPEGVEQVIAARIDRLPVALRAQLRQASVLGSYVDPPLAAAVLADPDLARPAAWSELEHFLERDEDGLRFRHDLYRRVAYQGLSVRRRRAIHLATAQALTAQGATDTSTLAQHLHAAQQWTRAFDAARQAAHLAREAGALGDALSLTRMALDSGRRGGEEPVVLGDLEDQLGDVADLLGRYAVADEAYRRAVQSGDPASRLDRSVKRAAVIERQGRYRVALGLLTKVERAAADPTILRAALLRRSSTLYRCGRLEDSRRAAQRAVELATDSALDRARGLLRLEMIASETGDPTRFSLGSRAVAEFAQLDEPRELGNLHVNLGVTAMESDNWAAAVAHYQRSAAAYRRAGDRVGAAFATNNLAEVLVDQGHLDSAHAALEEARRVFRASGHALGATATDSALSRILARTGYTDEARALLLVTRERFTALGATGLAADARLRLVEVALLAQATGLLEAATSCLADPEVGTGGVMALTAQRYVGIALALEGHAGAEGALRSAVDAARAAPNLHEVGSGLDHLLRLGLAGSAEMVERDAIWLRLGVIWAPDYGLG